MARLWDVWAPLLPGAALCISAASAAATEWQVQPDLSVLAITAQTVRPLADEQVAFDAVFESWRARIIFDPADPTSAEVDIEVNMTSLTSADTWGLGMARGGDWLAVDSHPTATWSARGAYPLEGAEYRFAGDLTLLGRTNPMTLDARILIEDDTALVSGTAALARQSYNVGTFAAPEIAASEVAITFEVTATRAP